MILEYEGTQYVGWQTQPNGIAVQEVVERAIQKMTGEEVSLHASGRTDSGVHALAQVAHFDTAARMPADKVAYALNTLLPRDIRIRYSDEAPASFHARFDAIGKQYRYTLLHAPHARAFLRNTALHLHGQLNEDVLHSLARCIPGTHDFSAFMATGRPVESAVRTVTLAQWHRADDLLYFDIVGNGFLYNMVRILVGTMLDAAKGILPPAAMQEALLSGRRADAGATAPAHGLMLVRVSYPGFDTADILGECGISF